MNYSDSEFRALLLLDQFIRKPITKGFTITRKVKLTIHRVETLLVDRIPRVDCLSNPEFYSNSSTTKCVVEPCCTEVPT